MSRKFRGLDKIPDQSFFFLVMYIVSKVMIIFQNIVFNFFKYDALTNLYFGTKKTDQLIFFILTDETRK